jgi:PAS domain S-box-containing protein
MVPVVPAGLAGDHNPEETSLANEEGIRAPQVLRAHLHYGSAPFGYVLAFVLISVTAAGSRALMERGDSLYPFVLFYPAIALASFLGGVGPGLASVLLGGILASRFFPYPPAPLNWIALSVLGPLLAQGFAHLRYISEQNRAISRELVNFKFMGDHASDWILLLGEAGHIRYVNLKASTDLGWTDRELIGRHIESLMPDFPGSQPAALNAALEQAKSGTGRPVELLFERRDRSLVLVELGCTAVRTGRDRVIYASARDISERKAIEKKLQDIRHWESLGALAGGLAHDFNNLLTSVLGNASLAKGILPPDHETAPLLDGIISAGERSSDLVRMLLATAGYRPRYSEPLQLDRLLGWTLSNRPLPSNVRVVKEGAEGGKQAEFFMGDRHSFETLFWSLISNAAEAYGPEDGEVRVAIRSGPAPIPEGASFEEGDPGGGKCLGIVVEDRGSGMSPEILKRAFDPFFSTRFTGRGLGLPAVRGIVRAYSGKLLVQTAVGRGTRVEVWLPLSGA